MANVSNCRFTMVRGLLLTVVVVGGCSAATIPDTGGDDYAPPGGPATSAATGGSASGGTGGSTTTPATTPDAGSTKPGDAAPVVADGSMYLSQDAGAPQAAKMIFAEDFELGPPSLAKWDHSDGFTITTD